MSLSSLWMAMLFGGTVAACAASLRAGEPAGSRPPSDTTYRVRRLGHATIHLDGRLDEPQWSQANAQRHFVFPWNKLPAPATEFRAFCDAEYLYFAFLVDDADLVVLDKLRDKADVVFEDRVEMFFSRDARMADYYCLEIDSRGRAYDYRASYYRKFDPAWRCKGLETAALRFDQSGKRGQAPFVRSTLRAVPANGACPLFPERGYVVEGRIPRATLAEMGLPRLEPGAKVLCGLYRAEFSHDRSGKPVVHRETIHNQGRWLDDPLPIEDWISWIDPKTPEPDFHVPSSLGWLEIVE